MILYLLHEYTEKYYPNYPMGKKFARTVILGFIVYYLIYFVVPLYFVDNRERIQHFTRWLILIDALASSVFYGGFLNGLSWWGTGKKLVENRIWSKRFHSNR